MADGKTSPVLGMVTVQVKGRSQIRESLNSHFVLGYGCACGFGFDTVDQWAEHVLDELFKD